MHTNNLGLNPGPPDESTMVSYNVGPTTRASKRARTTLNLPSLTPVSSPSSPPSSQPNYDFSSPLSTPPDSPQLLPTPAERKSLIIALKFAPGDGRFDFEAIQDFDSQGDLWKETTYQKNGQVLITIEEADLRSRPIPGAELLALVDDAKLSQKLPKLYDSKVLRQIDGQWFVPQICSGCKDRGRACNRAEPCICCTVAGIPCDRDRHMYLVRAPRKSLSITHSGSSGGTADKSASGLITHEEVRQTANRSRSNQPYNVRYPKVSEGGEFVALPVIQPQERAIPDPKRSTNVGFINSPENEINPGSNRGKKRKPDNESFVPEAEYSRVEDEEPDCFEHPLGPGRKTRKTQSAAVKRIAINKRLGNAQKNKPEPYGKPQVWADKRQQLCEVLPYYKAYQSAAYTKDGLVHSFMCDKEVGIRDKFDDQILIARVGGGKMMDEDGKMVQGKDQDKSRIAASFMRNLDLKKPLVLIAGEGNSISPTKLPHYYNVMDWFHITNVWCELLNGFRTWMVRLEKIDLLERSWWSPKVQPFREPPASKAELVTVERKQCELCGTFSDEIYNIGWTCLSTQCSAFFTFESGYDEATLDYNDNFLQQRTQYAGQDPGPLIPPLPTKEKNVEYFFGVERVCKEGIVCRKCGCCSRRLEWRQWVCENKDCDFTYAIPQLIVPVSQAIVEGAKSKKKTEFVGESIFSRLMVIGLYDVTEYTIPGDLGEPIGFVRVFRSNGLINSQPDGPNDLFRQMQEADLGLRRNAVRHPGIYIEMLTAHFAANWGATYKYGVAQMSKGFNEAPEFIVKAVKRLTWAGEQVVGTEYEKFHSFNELLSIGYMEGQHISYHDDGEKELGPTVATLSLGAHAMMSFRPKSKSPVEGNRKKPSKSANPAKTDVLRVKLEHGDIMIMHGRGIQSNYEHAVDPTGQLRFALTCRYVDPSRMATESDRAHAKVAGALPLGSEKYEYDGDINAVENYEPEDANAEVSKVLETIKAKYRTGIIGKAELQNLLMDVEDMIA